MEERELPRLRIVDLDTLVLHEETDPRRSERLARVFERDKLLKNPPIVAPLPDGKRYVVLDGANRTNALRRLELPHILVQIVDYDSVELDSWNHLVTGENHHALLDRVHGIDSLRLEVHSLERARDLLANRQCLAYLIVPDNQVQVLFGGATLFEQVELLNKVVQLYRGVWDIYRVKNDKLDEYSPYYQDILALLAFPQFTPADITTLAMKNETVPTGVTRHLIPMRALRVNYRLAHLSDSAVSLEDKNEGLKQFVRERLRKRGIRIYQESTVLFDE